MMLHEYESLTTEAAENISSADGKYFSGIPMRRFIGVFMCFNTTEQFIMEDLCDTWRQAGNYPLKSTHPSSVDWDKRVTTVLKYNSAFIFGTG